MTADESPDRMRRRAERAGPGGEVALFARMAGFGLIVGALYWFLTYETAGTVMLSAFGLASAVAGIAIALGRRAAARAPERPDPAETHVGVDVEPVPAPGWVPLGLAIGLGGLGLGAAFGPWLAIAGLIVTLISAKSWLTTAMRETTASRRRVVRHEEHD